MKAGGTELHWKKNPMYLKPTRKQMLDALERFKNEPVTVAHNCYIRYDKIQIRGLGLGHCVSGHCRRQWIRSGFGWIPFIEENNADSRNISNVIC